MSLKHIVQQGEYLSTIAKKYGFQSWRDIYDDGANAEFRRKRPNPNIILPNDELTIPDRRRKTVSCQTGNKYRFVVKTRMVDELILMLHVRRGEPLVNVHCEIQFTGPDASSCGEAVRKPTLPSGELRVPIVEGAEGATVTVLEHTEYVWHVAIGHLDPTRDKHIPFDKANCIISGVQARLNNIGFHCGNVDGVLGPKTRAAIQAFQKSSLGRDDPDGEIDEETIEKLEADHGA